MIIHTFEQRSPEWKAIRLGRFGSTDAQTVATNGKGLETLVYEKVAEIIAGVADESYVSNDMLRGIEQEPLARSSYEMQTGNLVNTVGYVEFDDFVGTSPDGLINENGLVEIKCVRAYNYIRIKHTKEIDTKYVWQMQHHMYCTGREWCDFVVFNELFPEVIVMKVEKDDKMQKKLSAGLEKGVELIKKIKGEL